jgi:predicted nucleotidyltransferase
MIPSMEVYEALKTHLESVGFEKAYGNEPYRLFYSATNTVIDLLPYGECAQNNTVKFTERSAELSIVGFQEVGEQTEVFEHPEGITIPVSPAHGIVILKIISWTDKPERTKDLKDIKALLDSAWELYKDEVYTENSSYSDLLALEPFDIHITAARIMGRKMQHIVNKSTQLKNEIYSALNSKNEQASKLSVQMAVETRSTVEKVNEIVKAILMGLEDGIN